MKTLQLPIRLTSLRPVIFFGCLFVCALFFPHRLSAQYTPPAVASFTYTGSTWVAVATTSTAAPLTYVPPAAALYCYNSTTEQWVPADSSCFGGQLACPTFSIYSQCPNNLNLPTFTPNNTIATAQGAIAPDGTDNAYAMKEDTTASVEHYSIQGPISYSWVSGSTHTFTIFARRLVGSRNMQMQLSLDGFTNTGSVGVNLSDCSNAFGPNIGGDVTATYTAIMAYPGWCKIQLNVTASGNHTTYYMDFSLINGSTKVYTGDGVSTNAYWGIGLQ